MSSSDPQSSSPARRRRVFPWLLMVAALSVFTLATIFLITGSRLIAGPGGPTPSVSDGPSDSTEAPTDAPPTDDSPSDGSPSSDPTTATPPPTEGEPSNDPSDSPGTATPSAPAAPSTPARPDPSSAPQAVVSTAPGELSEEDATALVEIAVVPPLDEVGTEQALDSALAGVVIDSYAEELHAQWLELTSQGWTLTGAPTVQSLEITALDDTSQPVTAEVLVCIDSSDVRIVDADGNVVGDPEAVMARAQHRFTMIQADDGIWRISSHAFPDAHEC